MKKYQIFVSSTYLDLIDERQAAVEAILKAGHIPAGMELFTASNQSQWSIIQRWIDESDVYMLILGGRYGSIEPESGLSYTELEYNYALTQNKPLFAVIIKDEALDEKVRTSGRSVLESENPQKMRDFKNKVLSYMSSFFEDHKDIKLAVHESVGKLQQENKLIGWVRADEVLNPKQYLDQITALQKEKEQLNKENTKLKNQSSGSSNLEADFDQLIGIFSKEMVSLKRVRTDENKYPEEISILEAVEVFKDKIVIGVANSGNATNHDLFVFFDLAPELQIHGLMQIEKITNTATARRVIATEKGKSFLAYLVKKKY
ncbi:hypothetical protein F951_02753 [Acinetobacter soli CIP 110264]|uniref:DUF4062 domain-containing protein n=1 Tax=Acinetobacter soli TaxID=487316 RepID=UPI0002D114AC|nr:DUF4062 domain-containing protein [Acinetobacter soli]ENV56240.1 hypothetical protein F951_02753 [Acinetobacter soli CIP 110264]